MNKFTPSLAKPRTAMATSWRCIMPGRAVVNKHDRDPMSSFERSGERH